MVALFKLWDAHRAFVIAFWSQRQNFNYCIANKHPEVVSEILCGRYQKREHCTKDCLELQCRQCSNFKVHSSAKETITNWPRCEGSNLNEIVQNYMNVPQAVLRKRRIIKYRINTQLISKSCMIFRLNYCNFLVRLITRRNFYAN